MSRDYVLHPVLPASYFQSDYAGEWNYQHYAAVTAPPFPELLASEYEYFSMLAPQIAALAQKYQTRKQADNVMDFDDLLVLWLKLLQDQADLRESYQRRFQFILVDEYQ